MTEERIAAVTDDTGDNISSRNRHYSETTALYWLWKNDDSSVSGICHYRRIWKDLPIIVDKFRTTDTDVVLPLPTLCEHSVYEDYFLHHMAKVAEPLINTLKRMSPQYYAASKKIFTDKIFYASNMFIARRKVINDLCEWMFPIVMETENVVGDLPDSYHNRYAGFCTERLITLYFLANFNNWQIAHGEKIFLS